MTDFLPSDIQASLDEARKRDLKRRSRLRILADDEFHPILRFWATGFALDAGQVDQLRGIVDIYDGPRHLYHALIVASDVEDGQLICTMKRVSVALDRPPLDYARDEDAPVGYLPRA